MIAAAAVLMMAASASGASSPAGLYEVRQMEMGGGLELKRNGRFRYAFTYGAVDEEAEGEWTSDGTTVRLTSKPMPTRPSFELVSDDAAPKGELYMTLENPGFEWGHPLEAIATEDLKSGYELSADEHGRVDLTGKPPVAAIAPEMPVHGPTGQIFRLSQNRGHRLRFRFHKNDLGKAAFDKQPLERVGADLRLVRYDTSIRFIRVRH